MAIHIAQMVYVGMTVVAAAEQAGITKRQAYRRLRWLRERYEA